MREAINNVPLSYPSVEPYEKNTKISEMEGKFKVLVLMKAELRTECIYGSNRFANTLPSHLPKLLPSHGMTGRLQASAPWNLPLKLTVYIAENICVL